MSKRDFLKSFFTEYWKYMTVSAACKLNLFDVLVSGEKTSLEISKQLNLSERNTERLLLALVSIDFLNEIKGRYQLNDLSQLLTDKNPESLKYACLNWSDDHLEAWNSLDTSIKSGKSLFENKYEMNYFDFLNQNKEKLDSYHKAMYAYARDDYKNIMTVIDFNKHQSIMDVGGGYGAAISKIKERFPDTKCYLFDLDLVIDKCKPHNDIILVKGDFFIDVPKIAEVILLTRILHDWDDEKATKILDNVYKSLPDDGYLYIIENCSDKIDVDLSLLSLNMLVTCESFERSSYDYVALANASKFKFLDSKKLNDLQMVLTFSK